MKKILLGTTGLIGAALLSAAANAETPKVTLGGFADFQAGYTSDDADTDLRGTAFRNDNEISVRVDGKTDGGLGYGAVIDLEADITDDVNNEGTNAARTFTYLEGSWGRFEMGGNKSAAESMRVDASSIAVATGGINGDWTYFTNDAAGDLAGSGGFITTAALPVEHGSSVLLNDEGTYNASKITYFTPLFAGFQVGASYTPDLEGRGQTVNRTETASFGEVLDLGVSFNHQFDNAWKLGAAFTYETADSEVAATEDIGAWNIGAHVGFQGFAVAASYGDWSDSRTAVAGDVDAGYYTLGAAYETGPFGLSATWLQSEVEDVAGAGTENEFENLVIGADYKLAPGLTPYAEVSFYEFDEEGTGAGVYDNDGTTFLLGTQIAF